MVYGAAVANSELQNRILIKFWDVETGELHFSLRGASQLRLKFPGSKKLKPREFYKGVHHKSSYAIAIARVEAARGKVAC